MRLGEQDARRLHARKHRRRRLASTAIFLVVTIAVLSVAGFLYTWYIGQQTDVPVVEVAETPRVSARPKDPPKPTKETQVGIVVQAFSTPVTIGDNASLSIRTLPGVPCTISFTVNEDNERSTDTGLIPKIADDYGLVDWTWSVKANVRPGTWPVEVTCANGSQSVYSRSDLEVVR